MKLGILATTVIIITIGIPVSVKADNTKPEQPVKGSEQLELQPRTASDAFSEKPKDLSVIINSINREAAREFKPAQAEQTTTDTTVEAPPSLKVNLDSD